MNMSKEQELFLHGGAAPIPPGFTAFSCHPMGVTSFFSFPGAMARPRCHGLAPESGARVASLRGPILPLRPTPVYGTNVNLEPDK